jgi:hypothetical protein
MDLERSERALIKALSWHRHEAKKSPHQPSGKMVVEQPTFEQDMFRIREQIFPSRDSNIKLQSSDFAHRFIHSCN